MRRELRVGGHVHDVERLAVETRQAAEGRHPQLAVGQPDDVVDAVLGQPLDRGPVGDAVVGERGGAGQGRTARCRGARSRHCRCHGQARTEQKGKGNAAARLDGLAGMARGTRGGRLHVGDYDTSRAVTARLPSDRERAFSKGKLALLARLNRSLGIV